MRIKTIDISDDVEKVLRDSKIDENNLVLPGQLDRVLYTKTNKILELIGFKWNRSGKCHAGTGDSASKLVEALNVGKVVNEKATYQFFETPAGIADQLAELADIENGHKVLEPSAGNGAIVFAIQRACPGLNTVHACEINPECVGVLKKIKGVAVVGDDFLQHQSRYDRIVANPPFCNCQDLEHTRHAYELLNAGGKLVSIMSPSWRDRSDKKCREFREWFKQVGGRIVEELEEGSFSQSGTEVRTVMVVLEKE